MEDYEKRSKVAPANNEALRMSSTRRNRWSLRRAILFSLWWLALHIVLFTIITVFLWHKRSEEKRELVEQKAVYEEERETLEKRSKELREEIEELNLEKEKLDERISILDEMREEKCACEAGVEKNDKTKHRRKP